MAQTHFYPCEQTSSDRCIRCNSGLTSPQGTNGSNGSKGSSASSGSSNAYSCEAYCNSSCNSRCETNQAYCYIGHQYIKDHEDVGAYHGSVEIKTNDFIHLVWTEDYWNSLVYKIEQAEQVGQNIS